ncbi:hypothetical protein [Bradyrhizobium sp. 143]|uniref:hypothetical protein n=1 Tax=Bradyrhizobium sp. 143 TaxID=2782619 RepID=UPI001FF74C6C|nr:hypothetical protein [Bradyrhizobium sp. 143]MCK1708643.1 hypothetical protein [Bradyrhizobium sp. 143]
MLTLKVAVRTLKNIVCECPAPTGRRMQKGSQSFVFCSSWPGNFELDLTRHFDDVLWIASVLEESVFQSFSAVDKKPPNAPRVSRATQLPARFLPTKTIDQYGLFHMSVSCHLSKASW